MRFEAKHLRTNEHSHDYEEVPEGTEFGFWRVVEHTGAGWYPLDTLYKSKAAAEAAADKWNERAR